MPHLTVEEIQKVDKAQMSQLPLEVLQAMASAIQEAIAMKRRQPREPKQAQVHAQFEHEDTKYGIVLPQLRLDGKLIKAEEAAADPEICAKLVALAKEGPDGERDESEFHENGILKIIYE